MLKLHCLGIAMFKFVDKSESNNYCLCTVCELYSNVFLLGKKIRTYVLGKKDRMA